MALGHLPEPPPHHDARRGKAEGERHPDAHQAKLEHKATQVAHGQRDDEKGDERNDHEGFHVGYATQGVGVIDLQAVAKLIDEEWQHEREHRGRHLGRVGEPTADMVAQQEDDAAQHQLKRHHDVQARRHRVEHVHVVALAVEVARAHSHGGPQSVIHHEGKLRYGAHHLMGGQGDGAEPSHHDDRQRERSRLHAHLEGDGCAEREHAAYQLAWPAKAPETLAVGAHALAHEEHGEKQAHHDHAREQGGHTGAQHAHLGQPGLTIYKKVVAHNVDEVAREQDPHRRARLGDAVGKLLEGVEQHHKGQRGQQHEVVGAHVGHQLLGLAYVAQVEEEHHQRNHHQQARQGVGQERTAQRIARLRQFASSEEAAHNGREAVGEARGGDDDEVHDVVDKRGRSQLRGAVVPHHHGVGKAQDDHSQLPNHDGQTQGEKRSVMVWIKFHVLVWNECVA